MFLSSLLSHSYRACFLPTFPPIHFPTVVFFGRSLEKKQPKTTQGFRPSLASKSMPLISTPLTHIDSAWMKSMWWPQLAPGTQRSPPLASTATLPLGCWVGHLGPRPPKKTQGYGDATLHLKHDSDDGAKYLDTTQLRFLPSFCRHLCEVHTRSSIDNP